MTVRALRESDIPILKAMAEASGYPYPDVSRETLECIRVVADDDDQPVMAAAAERLLQIYLWCGEFELPHAKMYALRLLHEDMASRLRDLGYHSAEAYIPPTLAEKFSKRLEKSFGWIRNWPSWTKHF